MKIDSHQHFWKYSSAEYLWIQPEWPLRRDFLPEHLEPLLADSGFTHCIAVQARQSIEETRWLCQLAYQHPFIAGVVGWVDLRSGSVQDQLASVRLPKLVGVRHVVQDEPDDNFMLRSDFQRGIAALAEFDLAYDILIFPRQLPAATQLVRKFPNQRFILDHLAKPFIKDRKLEPWASQIRDLAASTNTACKISGMVTEAHWKKWSPEDFRPYLDIVWDAFGEDRIMIGSDWPVSLLSSEYSQTMNLALEYLRQSSPAAQEKILRQNPQRFYNLPT